MLEVEFGPKFLPRLLHGSSPFMGAGQFGQKAQEWYQHFFNYPERMAELFSYFCQLSFPGVHLVGYPSIVEAARLVKKAFPLKIAVSLLPENWEENLKLVSTLEPELIFIHGIMTDKYLKKHTSRIIKCFEIIREQGSYPGLATHDSYQTLTTILSENPLSKENFGLLMPFNSIGWGMGASPEEIVELLKRDINRPIMVMKTLAAGKIEPRNALKFIFDVPQIKIATVGMTSKKEVEEIADLGKKLLDQ